MSIPGPVYYPHDFQYHTQFQQQQQQQHQQHLNPHITAHNQNQSTYPFDNLPYPFDIYDPYTQSNPHESQHAVVIDDSGFSLTLPSSSSNSDSNGGTAAALSSSAPHPGPAPMTVAPNVSMSASHPGGRPHPHPQPPQHNPYSHSDAIQAGLKRGWDGLVGNTNPNPNLHSNPVTSYARGWPTTISSPSRFASECSAASSPVTEGGSGVGILGSPGARSTSSLATTVEGFAAGPGPTAGTVSPNAQHCAIASNAVPDPNHKNFTVAVAVNPNTTEGRANKRLKMSPGQNKSVITGVSVVDRDRNHDGDFDETEAYDDNDNDNDDEDDDNEDDDDEHEHDEYASEDGKHTMLGLDLGSSSNAAGQASGFGMGVGVGVGATGGPPNKKPSSKRAKGVKACEHCHKLKMKCTYPKPNLDPGGRCQRCQDAGPQKRCYIEQRKPRQVLNKREFLLAQLKQKDLVIEHLVKQISNPYTCTPLSIAAYRLANGPSDDYRDKEVKVHDWLKQLKSGLEGYEELADCKSGGKGGKGNKGAKGGKGAMKGKGKGHGHAKLEPGVDADALPEWYEDDAPWGGAVEEEDVERLRLRVVGAGQGSDGRVVEVPGTGTGTGASGSGLLLNPITTTTTTTAAPMDVIAGMVTDRGMTPFASRRARYFEAGPSSDPEMRKRYVVRPGAQSDIVRFGLIKEKDDVRLFQIFFENVNPFLSLLDRKIHTPEETFARCPFLYTVICAIALRYDPQTSSAYAIAMHFAKNAAARALVDGWKTVELVQAYVLMAVYAVPCRRAEEDRTWVYVGLAGRLAMDLGLHLRVGGSGSGVNEGRTGVRDAPANRSGVDVKGKKRGVEQTCDAGEMSGEEKLERERLNGARAWIVCCVLDKTLSVLHGKPAMIKDSCHLDEWYKSSAYNDPSDIHLCALLEVQSIVLRFHEDVQVQVQVSESVGTTSPSPSGGAELDVLRVRAVECKKVLEECSQRWKRRFERDEDSQDKLAKFRRSLLTFVTNYSRLVVFSMGYAHAMRRGLKQEDEVFIKTCRKSAMEAIKCFVDELAPSKFLAYAPDHYFISAAFASGMLLRLLRPIPNAPSFISPADSSSILNLIERLVSTMNSPEVAVDQRHTAKLYGRFVADLIAKYSAGSSSLSSTVDATGAGSIILGVGGDRTTAPGEGQGQGRVHVHSHSHTHTQLEDMQLDTSIQAHHPNVGVGEHRHPILQHEVPQISFDYQHSPQQLHSQQQQQQQQHHIHSTSADTDWISSYLATSNQEPFMSYMHPQEMMMSVVSAGYSVAPVPVPSIPGPFQHTGSSQDQYGGMNVFNGWSMHDNTFGQIPLMGDM